MASPSHKARNSMCGLSKNAKTPHILATLHPLPGDNSCMEPPDPIPNSEVKRTCADGSVHLACESRSSPGSLPQNPRRLSGGGFSLWLRRCDQGIFEWAVVCLTSTGSDLTFFPKGPGRLLLRKGSGPPPGSRSSLGQAASRSGHAKHAWRSHGCAAMPRTPSMLTLS